VGLKNGGCKPCNTKDLMGSISLKAYGKAGAIIGAEIGVQPTIVPWSKAELKPTVVISAGAYLGAELCGEINGSAKKTIMVVN
jgi:hypothetical protein